MNMTDIRPGSTMDEVLTAYPGARRALMRRYHIGGCGNCGFQGHEQLQDVLKRHNVLSADEVIAHLKESEAQDAALQIQPGEVAQALRGDNPPRLIDVRSPQEMEICRIDGALPATQELVQEMMTSWPKDTPIVTYCHMGMRSLDAASYLIGHGFSNVRSMCGGIHAWSAEVDDTVPTY